MILIILFNNGIFYQIIYAKIFFLNFYFFLLDYMSKILKIFLLIALNINFYYNC
jgi:hypothetical protein